MTDKVQTITDYGEIKDWQERDDCKSLVSSKWKDRQKDLTKEDFEGLSFDYVAPHTFTDQAEGYWRWQFSWGGPGDELRAFVNRDDSIHRLEYWYLDWFDGAKVSIAAEHAAWPKMQEMILHTAPGQVAHS
jgi:hypothetical protein|tara:strand:- start:833 stop:1225 length:393 start_codon:yes stop_codon:yes gene_type:complete